jgi:hypothetical protein
MTDTILKDTFTNLFNRSSLMRIAKLGLSSIFGFHWNSKISTDTPQQTALVELAKQIAIDEFGAEIRRNGEPKYSHASRVAEQFNHDIILKQIAYLHDIIEDTAWTLNSLRELGFSKRVIDGVEALTKRENEPYLNYIMRLVKNDDARKVKMADITDNTQSPGVSRLRETFLYPVATAYLNYVDNNPDKPIPNIRIFIRDNAKKILPDIDLSILKQIVNDNSRVSLFVIQLPDLKFAS